MNLKQVFDLPVTAVDAEIEIGSLDCLNDLGDVEIHSFIDF